MSAPPQQFLNALYTATPCRCALRTFTSAVNDRYNTWGLWSDAGQATNPVMKKQPPDGHMRKYQGIDRLKDGRPEDRQSSIVMTTSKSDYYTARTRTSWITLQVSQLKPSAALRLQYGRYTSTFPF